VISSISPQSISGQAIELILQAILATTAAVGSLGYGGDIIVNMLFTIKKGLFFVASIILFFDNFFGTLSVEKEDLTETMQIGTEKELRQTKEKIDESKLIQETTLNAFDQIVILEEKDDLVVANEINQAENINEEIESEDTGESEILTEELLQEGGAEREIDPDLKRFIADIFQIDFKCGPNGVDKWVKKIFKTYKIEGRNLPICDVLAPIYPAFAGFISNAIGGLVPDVGIVAITTLDLLMTSKKGLKIIFKGLIFIVNSFYKQVPKKIRKLIQSPELLDKKMKKTFDRLRMQLRYIVGLKVSKFRREPCFKRASADGKEQGLNDGINDKYSEMKATNIEKIPITLEKIERIKETMRTNYFTGNKCHDEGFEFGYVSGYFGGFNKSKKNIERRMNINNDHEEEKEESEEYIPEGIEGGTILQAAIKVANPTILYKKLIFAVGKKVAKKVARRVTIATKLNKVIEKRIDYIESMLGQLIENSKILVHMIHKLLAFAYALMYIFRECA